MTKQHLPHNSVILIFQNQKFPGLLLTNYEQNFVRIAACFFNVGRAIMGV